MKNKSSLLKKLSLGIGTMGFVIALSAAINGFRMNPPECYNEYKKIYEKILYLEENKTNFEKSGYSFCFSEIDNEIKRLSLEKNKIGNTFEYKEWKNKEQKNNIYFVLGIMSFFSGLSLFVIKDYNKIK